MTSVAIQDLVEGSTDWETNLFIGQEIFPEKCKEVKEVDIWERRSLPPPPKCNYRKHNI